VITIALRMLLGDKAKLLGLVFGVAFSTLLICQQVSIFLGLLARASSVVSDVREADIWVMDPSVRTIDASFPLRDTELARVRGIAGVAWAEPFFKASVQVRTRSGRLESAAILGMDDATLVGVPDEFLLGSIEDLARPDAIAINAVGFRLLFPGEALDVGRELELNDRRARIVAIVDASPAFSTNLTVFTRYSLATVYTNPGRNTLSFIVAKAAEGEDPAAVAERISAQTELKSITSARFRQESINYLLANTGIPVSFGTVVLLGAVIGVAIVGLTFNQFIMENLRQFAALKAIGIRNTRLLGMTLAQATFVGVIGYGFGLGAAAAFFRFTANVDALRGFYLLPEVAIVVAVLVMLIVFASTLASMRRVLIVDPATVFRG
jgi:putative ABC transport system permease protein